MAKKKDTDIIEKAKFWHEIQEETTQAVLAIFSFLITLLSLLAAFHHADGSDLAGPLGQYGYLFFTRLFGVGYFLIPLVFAMIGIALLQGIEKKFRISKVISAGIFFLSSLGLIYIADVIFRVADGNAGGLFGRWVGAPLVKILDVWASTILLLALIVASIFIIFELRITAEQLMFWKASKKDNRKKKASTEMDEGEEAEVEKAVAAADEASGNEQQRSAREQVADIKAAKKARKAEMDDQEESSFISASQVHMLKPFTPPPLSLLEKDRGKPETGDIKANANIIKHSLQNFGITVEMDEICIGPSVTRYALKPAEGVKLSRIVSLNSDLSLALAAHPIRIEAPIPGKSLVGIEVPNTAKTTVGLATLLDTPEFYQSNKPLLMSLGKDITGQAHFCNLAKAPHMLIAGATGSGKSVTIHSLITSLLYRNSPENLRFIMIDPKRVELTLYNKIPHLLTPVITDPKKTILALKWAGKEMSRRYDILEKSSVRDVESYHKTILLPAIEKYKKEQEKNGGDDALPADPPLPETMPYIVIVIDELADIMQAYPRELESAIVRLAQMSRAVGIHLIVSTQRPSVNVITGLIKANIPSRVALQVASQIDSRTILDQPGAEKLLGAGDMLYIGGEMGKPIRLQSAFISESEVKRVVKFLRDQYKDEIMSEIALSAPTPEPGSTAAFGSDMGLDNDSLDEEDDMYEVARQEVISAKKASTSYIQRKLGIGYSRAAKLMDMLEERGVIGPANGSKPREIIGVGEGIEQEDGGSNIDETPETDEMPETRETNENIDETAS
jgi:S-DNA-T family DNA segregation ATPase FtsK/SpoIIIE